jgi:hypothetical protein
MSHALLDRAHLDIVLRAAEACGLRQDEVRLVSVLVVPPRDRHDVEIAVEGMTGLPCRLPTAEILDLEVRGTRCRVGLTDDDLAEVAVERALRKYV